MQLNLFHILLLPIVLIAYRFNGKFGNGFIHIISLVTLSLTIIRKDITFLSIIPVYYLAGLLTNKFKIEETKNRENVEKILTETRDKYQKLLSHKNAIEEKNTEIEEDIEEISNLYKITKSLNETLDLKETVKLIAGSINEACDFSDAKIILVDKNKSITQAYLARDETQKLDLKELNTDPLVRYGLASLMPISLDEDEIKRRVKPGTHIKSFTSVPLIIANEALGIITMADAKSRYKGEDILSRLCILSAQYAIEISKARLYEKLESIAITDGLTKVARRHHFLERYNEEVLRSKKYNLEISFLMADIDHFKNFNERYGHLYGDAVLREVAKLLNQEIREIDIVCRYGGEEFAIMLPETSKSQAKLAAERLRQSISQDRFQAYGEAATLTISIGVASLPDDATSAQELLDKADEALFRAKSEGRNRVCLY